jgi:hypothetical protein
LIGAAAWAQKAADEHVGRRQGLEARRFSLVDSFMRLRVP